MVCFYHSLATLHRDRWKLTWWKVTRTPQQLHFYSPQIALLLFSRDSLLNFAKQNISNKMWYYRILFCSRVFRFSQRLCAVRWWCHFQFVSFVRFGDFDFSRQSSIAAPGSLLHQFEFERGCASVFAWESGFNQLQLASRAHSPPLPLQKTPHLCN